MCINCPKSSVAVLGVRRTEQPESGGSGDLGYRAPGQPGAHLELPQKVKSKKIKLGKQAGEGKY